MNLKTNNTSIANKDVRESLEFTSVDNVSSSKFESEVTTTIDMLLAKSQQDLQEGKTIDHAVVMQQAAEWLKKK